MAGTLADARPLRLAGRVAGVRYRVGRDLRAQWRAAAVLALIVAVTGAAVLVLVAGALRTQSAPDRLEAAQGDRWDTQMEQGSGPPVTEEVAGLPAVREVAAAAFVFGGLFPEGTEDPTAAPPIDGLTFAGTSEGAGAEVVEGRTPHPDAPGEFVASRSFLEAAGAELGDQFQLFTISAESAEQQGFDAMPDGPSLPATLVGVIASPAELELDYPIAVFPATLLDQGSIGTSATESLVGLNDGFDVNDLRQQLDDLPEGSSLSLQPAEWVSDDIRNAVATQANALAIVALIAAIAASVVVGQAAARQARPSADQRQSLEAIGSTRPQLLAGALGQVGVPALVGALLAAVLAVPLSDRFPTGFVRQLEPDPGVRFDGRVHLAGPLLLTLGVLAWVGLVLVLGERRQGARRPASVVERLAPKLGPPQASVGLRFAFARHPRDAGAISTPVVGVIFVVAILIAAGTFGASLAALIADPHGTDDDFDGGIGQGGGPIPEEVQTAIAEDPDVEQFILLGNVRVNVGDDFLDITGFQPVAGDLPVRVLEGEEPTARGEIALGRLAAHDLDVRVGDELDVATAAGDQQLLVTGLAVIPGVEGGEGMGKGGLVTAETFTDLDPEAALTSGIIDFRAGAPEDAADRLSEQLGLQIGQQDFPSVITNLDRVRSAPYLIASLLALLAVLSVANMMSASLRHRGKEVAVLRAVGANPRWIRGVLGWHVLAITVAITLAAVPLGLVAGRLVFRTLADRIGAADDIVVPADQLALVFVGLLVVAATAAAFTVHTRRMRSVALQLAVE